MSIAPDALFNQKNNDISLSSSRKHWGRLGEAKLSRILRHQGVSQTDIGLQLARPAILAASIGRGVVCFFPLFLHFHSFSSFSPFPLFHLYYPFYLSSPFLWETTQNDPQGLMCR